jgi:hypothetical protein
VWGSGILAPVRLPPMVCAHGNVPMLTQCELDYRRGARGVDNLDLLMLNSADALICALEQYGYGMYCGGCFLCACYICSALRCGIASGLRSLVAHLVDCLFLICFVLSPIFAHQILALQECQACMDVGCGMKMRTLVLALISYSQTLSTLRFSFVLRLDREDFRVEDCPSQSVALPCTAEKDAGLKHVSYEDSDAISSSRIASALDEADGPQQI